MSLPYIGRKIAKQIKTILIKMNIYIYIYIYYYFIIIIITFFYSTRKALMRAKITFTAVFWPKTHFNVFISFLIHYYLFNFFQLKFLIWELVKLKIIVLYFILFYIYTKKKKSVKMFIWQLVKLNIFIVFYFNLKVLSCRRVQGRYTGHYLSKLFGLLDNI